MVTLKVCSMTKFHPREIIQAALNRFEIIVPQKSMDKLKKKKKYALLNNKHYCILLM